MALQYLFDIDDEFIGYLKNRFYDWQTKLVTEDGKERIRLDLEDGNEVGTTDYLPVYHKFQDVKKIPQFVDKLIKDDNSEVVSPAIVVAPRPIESLDDQIVYSNYDPSYDSDDQEVTLKRGKRRIKATYQVEGLAKRWHNFQLLKALFDYNLVDRDRTQNYISLFGNKYTVEYESPQNNIQEDSRVYRYIAIVSIHMNVYTLPDQVVESVETLTYNVENKENISN